MPANGENWTQKLNILHKVEFSFLTTNVVNKMLIFHSVSLFLSLSSFLSFSLRISPPPLFLLKAKPRHLVSHHQIGLPQHIAYIHLLYCVYGIVSVTTASYAYIAWRKHGYFRSFCIWFCSPLREFVFYKLKH